MGWPASLHHTSRGWCFLNRPLPSHPNSCDHALTSTFDHSRKRCVGWRCPDGVRLALRRPVAALALITPGSTVAPHPLVQAPQDGGSTSTVHEDDA